MTRQTNLLDLTCAGSQARKLSRRKARAAQDSEAAQALHSLSAASDIASLRAALAEAKPVASSLALQIPAIQPVGSIEREKLVLALCKLNVAMPVAALKEERLRVLEAQASETTAAMTRLASDVMHGGDARSGSGADLEADKAIMRRVAERANDFLARLEAAEQRDDATASRTTPTKRPARVSGMINSAVSALVSHVSPAHVRPPSRASHNADVGQLAH